MGQCGCGDGFGDVRLPGPDGTQYTIRVYNGCRDCHTGAAVLIDRYAPDQADPEMAQFIQQIPELRFDAFGEHFGTATVRVLDFDVLKDELADFAARNGADYDPPELMRDAVDECISEALFASQRPAKGGKP